MALATNITTGSSGHLTDHDALHTYSGGLPTTVLAGQTGHLTHHATLATDFGLPPYDISNRALHALAHNQLHVYYNAKNIVAPRTTAGPGGETLINPGDNWATKIAAGTTGTVFLVKAGTHSVGAGSFSATLTPKQNQKFYCESGAIIDGTGATFIPLITNTNTGVEIYGGIWKNFTSTATAPYSAIVCGTSWILDGLEVSNNTRGISGGSAAAPYPSITHSYIHHNNNYGLIGAHGFVDSCIVNNNGGTGEPGGATSQGGSKFVGTDGTLSDIRQRVSNCWFHHNVGGPGIWYDVDARGMEVTGNLCELNDWYGVDVETSYNARVFLNVCLGNSVTPNSTAPVDNGEIVISNAPNIEVYLNTCVAEVNRPPFIVREDCRGSGVLGPYDVTGLSAHDNWFAFKGTASDTRERVGLLGNCGTWTNNPYTDSNVWDYNTYFVKNTTGTYFRWNTASDTYAQWQAVPQDVHATRIVW